MQLPLGTGPLTVNTDTAMGRSIHFVRGRTESVAPLTYTPSLGVTPPLHFTLSPVYMYVR